MADGRRRTRGSFGAAIDQLVAQFPAGEPQPAQPEEEEERKRERAELCDRLELHAKLFERAWRIDPPPD